MRTMPTEVLTYQGPFAEITAARVERWRDRWELRGILRETSSCRPSAPAEDPLRNSLSSITLHGRRHVGVNLPGHEGARVVEPVAYDLDVNALVESEGRPGVA